VQQFLKSVNIWRSYRQEVTNTITYRTQKHFAAISFLLRRSRYVQSYCGNFIMVSLYIF